MKEYTCKDCKWWKDDWRSIALCEWDEHCHDATETMCPDFLTKDGKQTHFCHLASDIEAMSEVLVEQVMTTKRAMLDDWKFGWHCVPTDKTYKDRSQAVDAAKEWLIEVEE